MFKKSKKIPDAIFLFSLFIWVIVSWFSIHRINLISATFCFHYLVIILLLRTIIITAHHRILLLLMLVIPSITSYVMLFVPAKHKSYYIDYMCDGLHNFPVDREATYRIIRIHRTESPKPTNNNQHNFLVASSRLLYNQSETVTMLYSVLPSFSSSLSITAPWQIIIHHNPSE